MKVCNFLEFKLEEDWDVADFWLTFAKSVDFHNTLRRDGIRVVKLGEKHFMVAYHKTDQRRVVLPDGFVQCYGFAQIRKGTKKHSMMDHLVRRAKAAVR